ncbi:hypothetical protein ENSA5_32720 [Enhygromyxa salina]|uniref:ATP synthase I chain n=1 Tax=Enhygromyxa salina TaxID=215803 RepID=A0A2S9XXH9_9BACT|nr:hypothetical protein [Enhygromyxa salina]PRP97579.1 hypothetical protein ENSA5_32720 [Enhygromyxa salina]
MSEAPDLAPVDRRVLVRDAVRYACLGGGGLAGLVALSDPALAVSIVLGTVVGAVNFVLLARGVGGAIDRTVAGVERAQAQQGLAHAKAGGEGSDPADIVDRPRGVGGGLRLVLVVLLIAGVLWYPATEPMGLAIGVVLVLVAGSAAAYRHERARA